jgi:arginine decarboxylase
MSTIRVVGGAASAATAIASYDAALAAANVHNYNLVRVSSVVPAGATVERVDTAPDLGPPGNRLTVVEARATAEAGASTRVCAGLGWATGPGPGLFYEAAGDDPERVRATVERGLAEGRRLRDWTFDTEDVAVVTADVAGTTDGDRAVDTDADADAGDREVHAADGGDGDRYTTAVVLAAYGESEPVL